MRADGASLGELYTSLNEGAIAPCSRGCKIWLMQGPEPRMEPRIGAAHVAAHVAAHGRHAAGWRSRGARRTRQVG
eukprot:COSAG02_NODE_2341_length_9104_cov_2.666185_10_plen_75_part_00